MHQPFFAIPVIDKAGAMRKRYLVIFAAGILLSVISTPGILAAPRLKIDPPRKKIAADQTATLKVHLEWVKEEDPYEVTTLEPKLENLTLENQNQFQTSGKIVTQTFVYEFRPLKAGDALIYPFEVSYRKSDAEPWTPILVPEQKIKVTPAIPIKPVMIGIGITAGIFALAIAGIKIRTFLKDRKSAQNTPPPDPKQRVYAKTEESVATFSSPNPKAKLTHWANQLRTVVTTYYDLPARTITSAEILSLLKTRDLPVGEMNEVVRLFGQLDEMQFSRQDIPAYDLERMQKTLLQYVKGKIIIGNSRA